MSGNVTYTDERTGKVFSLADPQHEGWLTKQSEWIKDWRKRYFVLKGKHLFFAKDRGVTPHGMIDLSTCQTVKSADVGKKNALEVSTNDGQVYFMYAGSNADKDAWIGAIGRSIVQSGTTYQDDEPLSSDDENSD
jgi:hypothetical protein